MTNQQRVMSSIKTNSLIHKTALVVVLLVVGIFFGPTLLGQNGNGLLGRTSGQDEQVSEQSEVTQTPKGDLVEYVVYEQDGTVFLKNISTGTSSDKQVSVYPAFYEGNLGRSSNEKFRTTFIRKSIGSDEMEEFKIPVQSTAVSSNGNKLIGKSFSGDPFFGSEIWANIKGVDYLVSRQDVNKAEKEESTYLNPIEWLSQDDLIVLKGLSGTAYYGIGVYDVKTKEYKELLPEYSYVNSVYVSPSGKYFIYEVPNGKYDTQHYESSDFWLFEIATGKKTRILEGTTKFKGWTTDELKSASADFKLSGVSSNNCVFQPNNVIFKLPFACGEAYRVTRDGDSNTPSSCGLGAGSYPKSTWTSNSAPHSGKCAIDFADQQVGGTGSNQLPVLAAASGTVIRSRWENVNNPSQGFGQYVMIQHSDMTTTWYGHLSSRSVSEGQSVTQGQQIGTEGNTGSSTGEHIHFERRYVNSSTSYGTGTDSYWMEFIETGSGNIPRDNYIYISKNGNCPMNCSGVTTLSCANTQTLTNQTTVGQSNTRATYYASMPTAMGGNAATQNETGPERVYKITTTQTGTITVTLSNVVYSTGNDLDVFILRNPSSTSCSNLDPLLHTIGTSSGLTSTYTNAPTGTYYIVVDGVNGSKGTYTINVTAPCSSGSSIPNLTEYGSTYTSSGSTLTITAKPVNYGTVAAGSFSIGYWLSPDNILGNGNDIGLASVNYSGLSANSYNQFTFSVNTSGIASIGNYYILFKIDYLNQVTESNESDNVWMFNTPYYLPTSASSKTSPVLTPIKQIVADGIDKVIDNEEWTDKYEETQLVSGNQQEQDIWLWKDSYDRWVVRASSGDIITITDVTGKIIKTLESREDGDVWLPILPSGIYIITICCDNMSREKIGKIIY